TQVVILSVLQSQTAIDVDHLFAELPSQDVGHPGADADGVHGDLRHVAEQLLPHQAAHLTRDILDIQLAVDLLHGDHATLADSDDTRIVAEACHVDAHHHRTHGLDIERTLACGGLDKCGGDECVGDGCCVVAV